MCHRDGAMATVHVRRAKPPGLPHGKVRTAAQLLQNPDMLAHLSVFDEQRTDLVHWRVGFQRFFASRSPEHVSTSSSPATTSTARRRTTA